MSYKLFTNTLEYQSTFAYRYDVSEGDLQVVVAGEEEISRLELCNILLGEQGVKVIGEATDALDTIEKINHLHPHLVFLDVDMQKIDGFEIINNLNYLPEIVLTSTFHQHAIRAFESQALDFLLKPICVARVRKTISRARKILALERAQNSLANIQVSADSRRNNSVSRLAVHKGKRVLLLSLSEISYIKVENKLVFVFTENERYLVNRTITELQELLQDNGFFQINRAIIINLDYLIEIIPWFSGTYRLKLINGTELPLSRDRASKLKVKVGLPGKWSGK
jgi:DNA-binding LytR/AlgR family response regulator